MIELAETPQKNGKLTSKEAAIHDVYRSSVKVVAGARNHRELTLPSVEI